VAANFARAMLPTWLVARSRFWLQGHDSWMHPEFAARYKDRSRWLAYEGRSSTGLEQHVSAYLKTHSLPALLHHEDRNSMAFSIEARLPFLDARLVEFLIRLPAGFKLRDGRSKAILREAMVNVLPEEVRERTDKMGFVTPQDQWLRSRLRPDLESLFSTKAFEQRGYWDPPRLRKAYRRYCEQGGRIGTSVWRWACLELWHRRFFP
jgi:asparagine synthase (glutamine-hydrolysing)